MPLSLATATSSPAARFILRRRYACGTSLLRSCFFGFITPLLIVIHLEEFDYQGAAALGVVMLGISFVILLAINLLQAWGRQRHVRAAH